jgi:uncharacterized membrane protein
MTKEKNMTDINHPDPDQKKIVRFYGVFGLCIIMMVIPHMWAAALSIIMLLYVMFAAYYLRAQRPEDSLLTNHMTFVIRTIWISGLLGLVTLTAGCAYLLKGINNAPLEPCINQFLGVNQTGATITDMAQLDRIFMACMDNFVQANLQVLIISLLISGGPILLYMVVRIARGLSRAVKGYRVAKPKAWF